MSKFLTKNEIQNHQSEIRSTFALKDLITENNNLSPATFLTFCIISCRDIFLSCKTNGNTNTISTKRKNQWLSQATQPSQTKSETLTLYSLWNLAMETISDGGNIFESAEIRVGNCIKGEDGLTCCPPTPTFSCPTKPNKQRNLKHHP